MGDILRSNHMGWEEKKDAIIKAFLALDLLHDSSVNDDDYCTHGDASVDNVIIMNKMDTAFWIDFETVHMSKSGLNGNRLDDLQVLFFSAIKYLDQEEHISDLITRLSSQYSNIFLCDILEDKRRKTALSKAFFLARAGLNCVDFKRLRSCLLNKTVRKNII